MVLRSLLFCKMIVHSGVLCTIEVSYPDVDVPSKPSGGQLDLLRARVPVVRPC